MKQPATQADALRLKCRRALASHRKAATRDHTSLDYSAADLMQLSLASPICFYCHLPIAFTFEFDHKVPIARTPQAHRLANIVCSCPDCNRSKGGGMDAEEFRRLLQLLDGFDPRSRSEVLLRLKAGGRRYCSLRRGERS